MRTSNHQKLLWVLAISAGLSACNNGVSGNPVSAGSGNTLTGRVSLTCSGVAAWSSSTSYSTAGSLVVFSNVEYKNNWWTQGDEPDTHNGPSGSGQPWTIVSQCSSPAPTPTPTPTVSPTPSPTPTVTPTPGAYPIYPANRGNYTGGSIVQGTNGKLYQCLSNIVAPWCNSSADWAYAPGTGSAWDQAWSLVSNPTPAPTPSPSPSVSPTPTPTVSPTPTPTASPTPAPLGSLIYSAYKDVGINANWNTLVMSTKVLDNTASMPTPLANVLPTNMNTLSWAFATGECGAENWAGMNADQFATANMAAFNAKGLRYIVSTGGASGTFTCSTQAGMDSFYKRYQSAGFAGIDFDIEGGPSGSALQSLINMIAYEQQQHPTLRISFTLATLAATSGANLNSLGDSVVKMAQAAKINFSVNLMVMDYGNSAAVCIMNSSSGNCDMNLSAQQAAKNVSAAYNLPLSKIELTPMIGVNDTTSNVVSLSDATKIAQWAKTNGLAGVHYWSFDRDASCVNAYATTTCSSSVNGVAVQSAALQYLNAFAAGL